MTKRIYTWRGLVCVANDEAEARGAFGLKASVTSGYHDITTPLAELADAVLGPEGLTGEGAVDGEPDTPRMYIIVDRLQAEMSMLATFADQSREEAIDLHATLEAVARQLTAVTEAGHAKDLEIETLHRSLAERIAEVDRLNSRIAILEYDADVHAAKRQDLNDKIALLESSAETAAAEAEEAQMRAAWQGMAGALRDEHRRGDVVTIIIEPNSGDTPAELSGPLAAKALPEPSTPAGLSPPAGVDGTSSHDDAAPPQAAPCDAPPSPFSHVAETGGAPGRKKFSDEAEAALRDGYIRGLKWDALVEHVNAATGQTFEKRQLIDKSIDMGLRPTDRVTAVPKGAPKGVPSPCKGKSPANYVSATAPKPALPAVVAAPTAAPRVPVSRMTLAYGKIVQRGVDEFLSFDDIVAEITAERLTVQDIKKISLELKRLARDGVEL